MSLPRITLFVLLVGSLLSSGCMAMERQRLLMETQASPDHPYSTSGRRVVVSDEDGKALFKLRRRHSHYKVYDEQFTPLGYVHWQRRHADEGAGEPASVEISVRELTQWPGVSIQPAEHSHDTYVIEGVVSIARFEKGWKVTSEELAPVAIFTQGAETDSWELEFVDGISQKWTAQLVNERSIARRPGGQLLRPNIAELSPLALLATQLDSLPLLYRIAVAAWFMHVAPTL